MIKHVNIIICSYWLGNANLLILWLFCMSHVNLCQFFHFLKFYIWLCLILQDLGSKAISMLHFLPVIYCSMILDLFQNVVFFYSAGQSWQQSLYQALDSAKCVIALVSNDYLESVVCNEELNVASAKHLSTVSGIILMSKTAWSSTFVLIDIPGTPMMMIERVLRQRCICTCGIHLNLIIDFYSATVPLFNS